MTLWILFCRMSRDGDILYPFYAQDREEAEQKAEKILHESCYKRKDLKAYPYGFRLAFRDIPGVIEGDAL
jgi:hypothetical protein